MVWTKVCWRRKHFLRRNVELTGARAHVLVLLPICLRSSTTEALVVEEVPDLDADDSVPGGVQSLHPGIVSSHLRLLSWSQPDPHVQRLSLLVPLPQVLQESLQQKQDEERFESKTR